MRLGGPALGIRDRSRELGLEVVGQLRQQERRRRVGATRLREDVAEVRDVEVVTAGGGGLVRGGMAALGVSSGVEVDRGVAREGREVRSGGRPNLRSERGVRGSDLGESQDKCSRRFPLSAVPASYQYRASTVPVLWQETASSELMDFYHLSNTTVPLE